MLSDCNKFPTPTRKLSQDESVAFVNPHTEQLVVPFTVKLLESQSRMLHSVLEVRESV
jgi:hypothetical protein